MLKLVSWNVNGLRSCVNKGFHEYFNHIQADIFCLQETKLQEGQIHLDIGGEYGIKSTGWTPQTENVEIFRLVMPKLDIRPDVSFGFFACCVCL